MKAAIRSFTQFKLVAFGIALAGLAGTTLAWSQTQNAPTPNIPKIQHIIVVIQENRTPDNLFGSALYGGGSLPGADLAGSGQCKTANPTTITMHSAPLAPCWDPDHSHGIPGAFNTAYDAGKMDDACDTVVLWKNRRVPGCTPQQLPFGYVYQYMYVDNSQHIIDPYFNIAQKYGYANYMFQTNQGPSFPAHQFLLSGTSAPVPFNDATGEWPWFESENVFMSPGGVSGCPAPRSVVSKELRPDGTEVDLPGACYDHPTLPDLLDSAGLSWRWYGNTGDMQNPIVSKENANRSLWNAPNAISHLCGTVGADSNGVLICKGADWNRGPQGQTEKIPLNLGQLFYDLGDNSSGVCDLPAVSWVIPDGHWSDHPGAAYGDISDGGPSWVAAIVNAVGGVTNANVPLTTHCPYWSNTAVIVVWDDWGGWYDHVLPWNCNNLGTCNGYSNLTGEQYVYGFRVPMLVVSAWMKQPGYISGDTRTQSETQPYVHDFGSILNFIEYAFGLGSISQYGISGVQQYPYADYLAPDAFPSCNSKTLCPYGLSDFFNFGLPNPQSFQFVNGAKYKTSCFIYPNTSDCFGTNFAAMDPDDDVVDQ